MIIAQINVSYGMADSTGRAVAESHRWFLLHGIKSHVFAATSNDGIIEDKQVHLFSCKADRLVHGLLSRITGKQGYFSRINTKRLVSQLERLKPEIVILRVLHSNCVCLPFLFSFLKENKIPVVIILDDCWYYTGHCCHYTEYDCKKWEEQCGKCPAKHEWNKSWFFDCSSKNLKEKEQWFTGLSKLGVIGVSDWITNEARRSILKKADIIGRVYNWIDLSVFRPHDAVELKTSLGIDSEDVVLLGVASKWTVQKGINDFYKIAKAIPNARIVLVGELQNQDNMPENIMCVGKIMQTEQLADYYSMADVYINPSIQETFGKTTAEALSCGTPTVVYNTSACKELVDEDRGAVVPLGDTGALISAIKKILCNNPDNYCNKCRSFAEQNFSIDKSIRQFVNYIEPLVDNI